MSEEKKKSAASFAAGAAVGVGAAYVIENVDFSLKDDADVEHVEVVDVVDDDAVAVDDIIDDDMAYVDSEVAYVEDEAVADEPVYMSQEAGSYSEPVYDSTSMVDEPVYAAEYVEEEASIAVEAIDVSGDVESPSVIDVQWTDEMAIAGANIDGVDVLLIDSNNDGTLDMAFTDLDANGQLEITPLPDGLAISVDDAQAMASANEMDYMAPDDDYIDDDYGSDDMLASNDYDSDDFDDFSDDMFTDFA